MSGNFWDVLSYVTTVGIILAVEHFCRGMQLVLTREPSCPLCIEYWSITILLETCVCVLLSWKKIWMACSGNVQYLTNNACHILISCAEGENSSLDEYLARLDHKDGQKVRYRPDWPQLMNHPR